MSVLTSQRIGVLMGGDSSEREVSLRSGGAMEAALCRRGYHVTGLDVGPSVAMDLKKEGIEIAVIALHGRGGEDGAIQGLLEVMGIPYTGSGIAASAIEMNKVLTKRLLEQHGLPTPRYAVLRGSVQDHLTLPLGFELPVVLKPVCEGSTIGVSIVREERDFSSALEQAFSYGPMVLVEDYIDGQEATVGILEEEPLPVIEIVPKEEFYNYEAKYTPGKTEYILPARLPLATYREVQQLAVNVHQAIGCDGYSRVDIRVDRKFRPFVLEINTLPGMTESSLLPKAAKEA
ncbi:MAG TPA: D-alanine--D-alanine ligase, partial [Nitrospiria bacterium]|nr:D-alanine--D-alanine ligase [Nitrospiria bacterium]